MLDSPLTSPLTLTEAVPLAHALVARVCEDAGVRALLIKGPVLEEQGLRERRVSVDVDVLVDPTALSHVAGELEDIGWVDQGPYDTPTVMARHSITLRHPLWPCEIDVHDRFPGFLAPPSDVFELLWRRRTSVRIASRNLPCPDAVAHTAIAALHYLRDSQDPARVADLQRLIARSSKECASMDVADLGTLAAQTGAGDTLRPFLVAVGAPLGSTKVADAHELEEWRMRSEPADATAIAWLWELRRTALAGLPRLLLRAVWPTDREMRRRQPHDAQTPRDLRRARIHRLRRGLRALPQAVASIIRVRCGAQR